MSHGDDDLPPAIHALIADERAAPGGTNEARLRIRSRLLVSIGVVAAADSAAAASASSAAATPTAAGATVATSIGSKLVVLVLCIGVATGGATLAIRATARSPSITPAIVPSIATPAVTQPEPAKPAPEQLEQPEQLERPTPNVRTVASAAGAAAKPREPSQRELLVDATGAATADPTRALALLERDARLHPDGTLAEERDALRIRLLHQLGRAAEARALASAFLARYPTSIHRSLVERAIRDESAQPEAIQDHP